MLRPPSKRSFRHRMPEELDLTPIMGLFVGLLPFLLMVAVFTKVALISVPLPRVAQTEEEIRKVVKEKFYLRIYIVDDKTKNQVRRKPGYVVDSNALAKGPKFLPLLPDGNYDSISLNEIMLYIKKKNEKEKAVIMTPGNYVRYEDMIRTLDATRETLPDMTGGDRDVTGIELFPDVIMEKIG